MHALLTDFGLMKNLRVADADHAGRARVIGTFDYAAPEQLEERRDRRAHRRLRARLRALPGAHRQGPVPARDRRGEDVRPPRRAAAVGARACCPDAAELLGDVVAARDGQGPGATASRRPATSAAPRSPRSTARRPRPRAQRRHRRRRALDAARRADPAPARARGRDRARRVRRPRGRCWTQLERRYAAAEAGAAPVRAARRRAGDRQDAAGHRARAGARTREGATVLYGRSDAESLVPYQPFITALTTTSPTASTSTCRPSSRSS